MSLPPVSAQRALLRIPASVPFVQIRIDPAEGAPSDGLQVSALLRDTGVGLDVPVGETLTICFDGSDPYCQGQTIQPDTEQVFLAISNADPENPIEAKLLVSTIPVELTGKQIKVGETESDFKGLLTFIRTGRDTFKLEATHLWFEFDDETYDRMIPEEIDTGSASDANISSSLIRGYVRRHAEFRGFVELEYEIDDEAEPTEEDGLWWVGLKTRREREGNFFATPHKFFLRFDADWYRALGGALGIGGIVFERAILRLNKMAFPDNSFASTLQGWFTETMTLGTPKDGEAQPRYTVNPDSGELLLRMGNTTVTFRPA